VQSFGVTMLIGVTAAYLLAPIASRSVAQRKPPPR
jgi:hypothetical protein